MDQWSDRLSEYLDGGLATDERLALDAHLAGCAECAQLLEELRRVVARARALPSAAGPAADLWPGIESRIRAAAVPGRARTGWRDRRVNLSMPQLMAATIAALMVSGAAVWIALSQAPATQVMQQAAAPPLAPTLVALASTEYDAAVTELEQLLRDQRDRLDPATVAVLEHNLRIIDQAVTEAQGALSRDPANVYLNNYLAENMRRKLKFLRQATGIVRAET